MKKKSTEKAKKKAIKFLNKKNAAKLLKKHKKQQKADEIKPALSVKDRIKRKRRAIIRTKH